MEMIPSSRLGFLGGVFLANHLASNDNNQRTEHKVGQVNVQNWENLGRTPWTGRYRIILANLIAVGQTVQAYIR